MEATNKYEPMLELMLRPAFCVSQGRISKLNAAAAPYLLSEGAEILPLLATGAEEYQDLTEGCLYLTLAIGGQQVGATVIPMEDCQLFLLEQPGDLAELRALSLAAQQLRGPLSGMSATASQLTAADPSHLGQLNHRMHQMLRIVSNMADALEFCQAGPEQMEYLDLGAHLKEQLDTAALQLLEAEIHLEYHLPPTPVFTIADKDRVERAVYNLLCNAAKHTEPGGKICVTLVQRGRLYLSVSDEGPGLSNVDVYTRYLRTPSILDGQDGIGLGMVLVRAVATLHGGTVLIDHPQKKGTRVTMTLQLQQKHHIQVRSPLMHIDYAGERDHGLQELADVLPARLYAPEKI